MRLIYDSLTGNVRRLAQRVAERAGGLDVQDVRAAATDTGGDYLLLTYTFHRGEVPDATRAFLARAVPGLRGVVASGSYHWGANFARAADLIAAAHAVPVVAKLNKGGTEADMQTILRWLEKVRSDGVQAMPRHPMTPHPPVAPRLPPSPQGRGPCASKG